MQITLVNRAKKIQEAWQEYVKAAEEEDTSHVVNGGRYTSMWARYSGVTLFKQGEYKGDKKLVDVRKNKYDEWSHQVWLSVNVDIRLPFGYSLVIS